MNDLGVTRDSNPTRGIYADTLVDVEGEMPWTEIPTWIVTAHDNNLLSIHADHLVAHTPRGELSANRGDLLVQDGFGGVTVVPAEHIAGTVTTGA